MSVDKTNKSLIHEVLGVHYIQDYSNFSSPSLNTTENVEFSFGILIISLALFGFVVNCCAMVILHRKKLNTVFHQLLRFLSLCDILVCLCGCLTYGLPPVWNLYKEEVLTRIGPWISPITHAALMTSVYCTVILSLERYVRICYLCQLKEWSYPYITMKNVNCYKLGLIVIPIVFYLPKFFELRWAYHKVDVNVTIDCEKTLSEAMQLITTNFSDGFDDTESAASVMAVMSFLRQSPLSKTFMECFTLQSQGLNNYIVTESRDVFELMPTSLRMNSFYYKIYCVFLNSTLASFLPLAALLYLNTCTVKALKNMALSRPFIPLQQSNLHIVNDQRQKNCPQADVFQQTKMIEVKRIRIIQKSKRSFSLASVNITSEIRSTKGRCNSNQLFFSQNRPFLWNSMDFDEKKTTLMMSIFPATLSTDDKHFLESRSCPEFGANKGPQNRSSFKAHKSLINLYLKNQQSGSKTNKEDKQAKKNRIETPTPNHHDMQNSPKNPPRERAMSIVSELNTLNHTLQHNNAQEQRLARISTSIVWLFIVCHIWRMIPTVYEYLNSDNGLEVAIWPTALDVVEHISHSLILTNSAVNFLIYVFM